MTPAEENTQDRTPVLAEESEGSHSGGHQETSAIPVLSGHALPSYKSAEAPQTPMSPIPTEGEILRLIAANYLQTTPPKSKADHNEFLAHMEKMRVIVTDVGIGSLLITVKCDSLEILETLWEDYSSGNLGKVVQRCFVTKEILTELSLAEIKLQTTISKEEYLECKMYFEKHPAGGPSGICIGYQGQTLPPLPPRTERIPPPLPPRPNLTPPYSPSSAQTAPPPLPPNAQSTSSPPPQHVQLTPTLPPSHAQPTLAPRSPHANWTSPPPHSQSTSTTSQPHTKSTNQLPPYVPPTPPSPTPPAPTSPRVQSRPTSPQQHAQSTKLSSLHVHQPPHPSHAQSISTSPQHHAWSKSASPQPLDNPTPTPPSQHAQLTPTSPASQVQSSLASLPARVQPTLDLTRPYAQPTPTSPPPQSQSAPEENREEMEEKLKKLEKVFSCSPSLEQSRFPQNQLFVCGLSALTTEDCLVNFIEATSGGEVEDVMMRNDKALITMANDITDFSKIKIRAEKRRLHSAKVTIEQVPVCTSIVVSGISDNTTRDAIELYFESPKYGGGSVERVEFIPKGGIAVVVFQDPKDVKGVLARQKEKPHVLNQAQLSIRIYHKFLESEESNVPDNSNGLRTTTGGADHAQVRQQSEMKEQILHIAVDPDLMEFVTTRSAFRDQLSNSLTAKKCEITWKPNNKVAVIVYQGGDESDSWQSECIDEIQNYLGKFAKSDVQVNKDSWRAVVAQLSGIRASFGVDPPLVKLIDGSFVARIVSLRRAVKYYKEKLRSKLEEIYQEETGIVSLGTAVKDYEEELRSKLEEIYRKEIRRTYLKKTVSNVPKERLILLKKIKFVERLQEKYKELDIKLDTEGEEIYFEGPQSLFKVATMQFFKLMSDVVEKTLPLSCSILKVLGSDEGLKKVKTELENNDIEAVFVIDKDSGARIVSTTAAHWEGAEILVNRLTLEEKVQVDDKSECLLKTPEWHELCDEINTETTVCIHQSNWNGIFVAGFHDDVKEAMKRLNTFLENNCVREEQFLCSSEIIRRYLAEFRHDDLRSIENNLRDFEVKIKKGRGDNDFVISGNRKSLTDVRRQLIALLEDTVLKHFDAKQPGLRWYFESGKGDRLVKLVEKEQNCAIQVQMNFGQSLDEKDDNGDSFGSSAAGADNDDDDDDDDDDDASDDNEQDNDGGGRRGDSDGDDDENKHAVGGMDPLTLVMNQGHHKISWRTGMIETEKANALVCSVGATSRAIIRAGVLQMTTPNAGDIAVSPGSPLANHVINTYCGQWNGGKGEASLRAIVQKCLHEGEQLGVKSIAFPVVGTGNHNFPRNAASRIMLEETIRFCQANSGSKVQDIRFVVFEQDQALTAAFKQEMNKLKAKHKSRSPAHPVSVLYRGIRSKLGRLGRGLPVSTISINLDQMSNQTETGQLRKCERRQARHLSQKFYLRFSILGKKNAGVDKAVESLKRGIFEACFTDKVENEVVSQLSHKQIVRLRRKAEDRDVKLEVEADVDRIVARGQPTDVSGMVGEIWKEINERTKKNYELERAQLVSTNIEWSYKIRGSKMVFDPRTKAKIEIAYCKDASTVKVSLSGEQFILDLKAKSGRGQRTGEQITLKRKVKGAEEGIPLPKHWVKMPSADMTVHTVPLSKSSSEYKDVMRKFQTTVSGVNILKIERIQNPHLYQCYMVRKQKMDKDIGGDSERQLFHGSDSKNVSYINTQGFNRSLCGAHGIRYGQGTYFARDASYSLRYARAGDGGRRYMYLARVLVGQYCVGNASMKVPPEKHPSRPEILYESVVDNQVNPCIFVVFYDNQCYPEYLITMQ